MIRWIRIMKNLRFLSNNSCIQFSQKKCLYIPQGIWQTRTVSHVPRLLTPRHCSAVAVNRGGTHQWRAGGQWGGGGLLTTYSTHSLQTKTVLSKLSYTHLKQSKQRARKMNSYNDKVLIQWRKINLMFEHCIFENLSWKYYFEKMIH